MNRIGIEPNRIVAVVAALLLAVAGIATVVAQALGPAGPSPAGDNAEVVAQAVFELPQGEAVWRIRNISVEADQPPVSNDYPAFLTTDGVPVLVEDEASGVRQRVASGEATMLVPGHEIAIRSLGPRQLVTIIDVLPVAEATLSGSSGRISLPFPMEAGTYDVDFIIIDIDEGETSTVPMGNGPSQLMARSGQAEIQSPDETFNMTAGSDRLAAGDLTITANTDDTELIVVRIGAQVEVADATPAATPEATPAPATPAAPPASTPVPATPAPAEVPQDIDSDGDGIVNSQEIAAGTNPDVTDTDGDGLTDGDEATRGTDPLVADTDDDGVPDGQEITLQTDPLNSDTDGDLLYDGGELLYASDPLVVDTDGDGLTDGDEVYFSETSPAAADSDGDGVNDSNEVAAGTDPNDSNSFP